MRSACKNKLRDEPDRPTVYIARLQLSRRNEVVPTRLKRFCQILRLAACRASVCKQRVAAERARCTAAWKSFALLREVRTVRPTRRTLCAGMCGENSCGRSKKCNDDVAEADSADHPCVQVLSTTHWVSSVKSPPKVRRLLSFAHTRAYSSVYCSSVL